MADDKPQPEPMTDEAIDSIVELVETICLLASALDVTPPAAARILLKSSQVMARMKKRSGMSALVTMVTGKIQ